jgi:hypothetical protein
MTMRLAIFYIGIGDAVIPEAVVDLSKISDDFKDVFERHGLDVIYVPVRGTYECRFEVVT